MGRKIEMKKIEETTKRQITFSKRRSNLMKKAEEIAVCCDVDVLFVAFSPSGRISIFCSKKSHIADTQKKMEKLGQLNHINGDVSKLHFLDKQDYEPRADQETSLHQLNWCERNLQQSLQKVMARKMGLEKQGKMDVHLDAQQTTPQELDTSINPYSTSIQGSMFQDWIDKGKRVSGSSINYAYNTPYASSSQCENISLSPIQNLSYISMQSEQQNMVVDVQQNPTQAFEQSETQVTFGESIGSSIMDFWHNLCNSTRPVSGPLSTMGTQSNNLSQFELEYAHSNWSMNLNHNNNNHIIQHNDHSSVQSDARVPNVNGSNYYMKENTMGNNEYFVEKTHDNDSWEWDDDFLNEIFSVEDFRNLD
ncbi:MADS-box transcription factor 57-like isoform X2 [Lycium barbarum]|uniref:MADS-box transcription factor 57-like isoform X2 n=1 Tax=Lycium barbarum TaxID=112863 RepID=UPI00293F4640|nr:MADS-box transcription factor 57-like isoform X2 [Lycium barbarum]